MSGRFALALIAVLVVGCASETASQATIEATTTTEITLLATTTSTTTTTVAPTTTVPPTTSTSTTSTTTTTLAPTTTTTVDPMIDALLLSEEGIGSAEFGADPDGVIDFIASFLGEPTQDTDWVDPLSIGPCPGTQLRLVTWSALTLEFSDESTVVQGRPHFYSYSYGIDGELGVPPVGLLTEEEITTGSSVSDLTEAYPDVALNPENEFSAASFYLNDSFSGLLTGVAGDDLLTVILGGRSCRE